MRVQRIIRRIGIIFFILPAFCTLKSQNLTLGQWKEDFDSLRNFIETKHVSPFWLSKEENWQQLIKDIENKLENPQLTNEERVTLFTSMVAFTKDGHSGFLDLGRIKALPLQLKFFGNEIYIAGAPEKHKALVGCRIVAWEDLPWETVRDLIRPYVPCANESGFKLFSPFTLINGSILNGLHIIDQMEEITLTLQDRSGNEFKSDIKLLALQEYSNVKYLTLEELLNLNPIQKQQPNENYWYTYLPDKKIIYFNYHHVNETPGRPFKSFIDSLMLLSKSVPFNKFIIDLRENDGGNNFLSLYLLEKLCTNNNINKRGKLFVITGPKTFSAAICFASQLQMRSQALFVGESPGDAPSGPGDVKTYSLPNSKGTVSLSHLFWNNTFTSDKRAELTPDLPYAESFQDYVSGKDGAFDLAASYISPEYTTEAGDLSQYLGIYEWEPDKDVRITQIKNGFFLDAIGSLQTRLCYEGNDYYSTKIKNIGLSVKNRTATLIVGDQEFLLRPLNTVSLLRNLYNGNAQVEDGYLKLARENPMDLNLKGNNITMQAGYLFQRTRNEKNTRKLLEISLILDPHYTFAGQLFDYFKQW